MEIVRVDDQGRVYLPKAVRAAAAVGKGAVLEIRVIEGKIVLTKRRESIAESSRGIFKLKEHIKDVDKEIMNRSVELGLRELKEIRRKKGEEAPEEQKEK